MNMSGRSAGAVPGLRSQEPTNKTKQSKLTSRESTRDREYSSQESEEIALSGIRSLDRHIGRQHPVGYGVVNLKDKTLFSSHVPHPSRPAAAALWHGWHVDPTPGLRGGAYCVSCSIEMLGQRLTSSSISSCYSTSCIFSKTPITYAPFLLHDFFHVPAVVESKITTEAWLAASTR